MPLHQLAILVQTNPHVATHYRLDRPAPLAGHVPHAWATPDERDVQAEAASRGAGTNMPPQPLSQPATADQAWASDEPEGSAEALVPGSERNSRRRPLSAVSGIPLLPLVFASTEGQAALVDSTLQSDSPPPPAPAPPLRASAWGEGPALGKDTLMKGETASAVPAPVATAAAVASTPAAVASAQAAGMPVLAREASVGRGARETLDWRIEGQQWAPLVDNWTASQFP